MSLSIKLNLTPESKKMLRIFPDQFKDGFYKGLRKSMWLVEKEAKTSFGKTGKPKTRSGSLRRSIQSNVIKDRGDDLIGVISSDMEYAALQEYGGRIRPKGTKEYLRFKIKNNWVSLKESIIPARPFLKPAIQDNLNRIEDIISEAILSEVK